MDRVQVKTDERHVIWGNIDLDLDDWRDDLAAEYPDLSEERLYELMYEINADYLDDERANLNIKLDRPIIAVGDLGLWYGRRSGYKMIDPGNIRDCLYSDRDTEMAEWYVDKYGDLRADMIHHDGTNHILYRAVKSNVKEWQLEALKDKIYCGRATWQDIAAVTERLGDEIASVYGFDIPHSQNTRETSR